MIQRVLSQTEGNETGKKSTLCLRRKSDDDAFFVLLFSRPEFELENMSKMSTDQGNDDARMLINRVKMRGLLTVSQSRGCLHNVVTTDCVVFDNDELQ